MKLLDLLNEETKKAREYSKMVAKQVERTNKILLAFKKGQFTNNGGDFFKYELVKEPSIHVYPNGRVAITLYARDMPYHIITNTRDSDKFSKNVYAQKVMIDRLKAKLEPFKIEVHTDY